MDQMEQCSPVTMCSWSGWRSILPELTQHMFINLVHIRAPTIQLITGQNCLLLSVTNLLFPWIINPSLIQFSNRADVLHSVVYTLSFTCMTYESCPAQIQRHSALDRLPPNWKKLSSATLEAVCLSTSCLFCIADQICPMNADRHALVTGKTFTVGTPCCILHEQCWFFLK